MTKIYCEFDCGREATVVPHNGKNTTCDACYMRIRYARLKGTAWMIKRSRRVGSWQNSLSGLLGDVSKRKNKKARLMRRRA